MEDRKIYPYLIDANRIAGYYELLLDDKFKLKIFNKKQDKEIYDYFLPIIKNYMFWTFNMRNEVETTNEFKKLSNDLQSAVCAKYQCNIFEKDDSLVICFNTGICFAITANIKIIEKLVKYEEKKKMQEINLRENASYQIPASKDIPEAHMYAYILQLYKRIYLNKLEKEIKNPNLFDKVRHAYVYFTQELYDVKITDKDNFCEELQDTLELDKQHLLMDNEFDLLYKNNKLNNNQIIEKICIILFVILIIIGIINLGNSLNF